ncbi:hypothetical protein vseg_012322 [Gypsophila vaccaria]
MLFGKPANLALLRVFGCLAYAKNVNPTDKFDSRSRKCVFLGYPFGKKGWTLFDLETGTYFHSRDVSFIEDVFPYSKVTEVGSNALNDVPHDTIFVAEESVVPSVEPVSAGNGISLVDSGSAEADSADAGAGVSGSSPNNGTIPQNSSTVLNVLEDNKATAHSDRVEHDNGSAVNVEGDPNTSTAATLGRGKREKIPRKNHKDYVKWDCINTSLDESPTTANSVSGSSYPLSHFVNYDKFSPPHRHFIAAITRDMEPRSFKEAMGDARWRKAMSEEIAALESNNTWTVSDLPSGKVAIGCMWVFKIKHKSDGSIERFKARLVVLGNHQEAGVDFKETFAPTVKMVTVRTFLAVVTIKNWELHQMDVDNAFLHGDLVEEVYMRMPPGFSKGFKGKVCRLRKSIYGLRQAPRCWYAKLATTLSSYGFIMSASDNFLFTFRKNNIEIHILIYVDDLVIVGYDSQAITAFKSYLSKCFYMKDLGKLKYFLGLEVAHSSKGLFLCQRKYTLDLLSKTGLLGCKPASVLVDEKHQLALAKDAPFEDGTRYRRLVGKLIYLCLTRPDISYSVHILSQFMQKPTATQWDAALRVVRYLKNNPGQGILFRPSSVLKLEAYCDAAYGSCPITRRSITAYFVCLGGSPISWRTKKQATVALSSTEAEYRAMTAATCEILWLKGLLEGIGIRIQYPVQLHYDNESAMHIANNPVYHERTKHIEIDCHFIRTHIRNGVVLPCYVHTQAQLADILTKALGRPQFTALLAKLGISDSHALT